MEQEKFYYLLSNQHLLNNETVVELKLLTENKPWFQLGWMMYLKNLREIDSPDYETILKKVAVRVTDRKLLYNFLNAEIQRKSQKTDVELLIQDADESDKSGNGNPLIDKFLTASPGKILRSGEDENASGNDSRAEIVEKSDAENDDMITETLAAIYVQQKNFEKAIKAYEKLSLKYPEKSIYFAGQIKEIEKLKNTNS